MTKFCSLFSGSSGNSLYLQHGGTRLLIDAGVSGIRIQNAMHCIGEDPGKLNAILVTHEHSDHSSCVGVMSRRFDIPVYANRTTWGRMSPFIGEIRPKNILVFTTGSRFQIGDISVRPFSIPHDAAEPVGFNFFTGDRKITVATDLGHMNRELFASIRDSDLLMLESNHDLDMLDNGSYPFPLKKRIKGQNGHLCNDLAAQTIAELAGLGVKRFIIGHLSNENNIPELAYRTVEDCLYNHGFLVGRDVELDVVLRDTTSRVFEI